jgi:hypothetical protein
LVYESQTVAAYSSASCTIALYATVKMVGLQPLRFLLMNPKDLFAFGVVFLIWVFHFKS